jgi:hypothetical protein
VAFGSCRKLSGHHRGSGGGGRREPRTLRAPAWGVPSAR